jgi:hypothetical protein
LDKLDDLDNLDKLDTTLLVSGCGAVCIGFVAMIPWALGWMERVMAQHHPYDEIRVTQINLQRVTIWKNVCLLFLTHGANRFEGGGSRQMLMGGVKTVCQVCMN